MATIIGGITSSIAGLLALYILFWIIIPTARGAGTAGVKGAVKYLFAVLIVIFLAGIFIPPVIDSTFLRLKSWGQKSPITHEVGSIVGYADEAGLTGEGTTFRDALSLNLAPGASLPGGVTAQQSGSAAIDPVTGQPLVPQTGAGSSVIAPAAPQPTWICNDAEFLSLYQAWFGKVGGNARLQLGAPPKGYPNGQYWVPQGSDIWLEYAHPNLRSNYGTLKSDYFQPVTLTDDTAKAYAALGSQLSDSGGVRLYLISGALALNDPAFASCWQQPTEASVTVAPPANDANAGGGGPVISYWPPRDEGSLASEWLMYAMDGVTVSRSIPAGSPLQSCGQQGEFLISCQEEQPGQELFRDPTP